MGILEFKNVWFKKDNKEIIKDLSFSVEANDFISIVGPSGSGKSTVLKLSSHLISPSNGAIMYQGKDLLTYNPLELRQQVCYCFQIPHLFGNKVEDNFSFPYFIRNMKMDKIRVLELLKKFNLPMEVIHEEVKNLSGGEKQRIALIRTLLFKPTLILLDEVTSALDADNTIIVEEAIKSLNNEGVTVLWVTHSIEQSRKYANKIMSMENGELRSLEVLR